MHCTVLDWLSEPAALDTVILTPKVSEMQPPRSELLPSSGISVWPTFQTALEKSVALKSQEKLPLPVNSQFMDLTFGGDRSRKTAPTAWQLHSPELEIRATVHVGPTAEHPTQLSKTWSASGVAVRVTVLPR
jgi:hypothetical protein